MLFEVTSLFCTTRPIPEVMSCGQPPGPHNNTIRYQILDAGHPRQHDPGSTKPLRYSYDYSKGIPYF